MGKSCCYTLSPGSNLKKTCRSNDSIKSPMRLRLGCLYKKFLFHQYRTVTSSFSVHGITHRVGHNKEEAPALSFSIFNIQCPLRTKHHIYFKVWPTRRRAQDQSTNTPTASDNNLFFFLLPH